MECLFDSMAMVACLLHKKFEWAIQSFYPYKGMEEKFSEGVPAELSS